MVTYDEFAALDIRIGTVLEATKVEGSEKLIKFIIDLGDEKRQIIGGLAPSYPDPQVLVGKQLPVLINLESKKLMGLESQGMVLAASGDDGKPVVLHPDTEVPPGTKIK